MARAFSFELSHCDDAGVYTRMAGRLNEIDFALAREVALSVGGPVPERPARGNHGETSRGLSQRDTLPEVPTIATRRIALLVADGVHAAEVEALCAAVRAAGATAWLVGPRRGTVSGLQTDHHFEGARSTLFDAVLVPSGAAHARALAGNGRAVHWVREAFGHLKPIGAVGEGACLRLRVCLRRG